MKKFVVLICILAWGCSMEVKGMVYTVSDVNNVKYEISQSQLELQYQTPLETLYYSPGINYRLSADGKLELQIVRCGIKEKCEVAAKAQQGEMNRVVIELPKTVKLEKIYLTDGEKEVSLSELSGK
ncbi:hypothetical protein [Kangiella koreensis]|uniref:Uncharacterized protein n=1 Tax=Kangiella koreensis (strain DSM 16069 / JCM 12317 / KCTC 12182 / SW-125) TaxID=523791 RepID=C7R8N6_KANKD|nr:hypothetical protein [Kangiella koreensis]ACV25899.1 hypothetical protein Kkor_0479 [Kangiella koreensis DSM 16069]